MRDVRQTVREREAPKCKRLGRILEVCNAHTPLNRANCESGLVWEQCERAELVGQLAFDRSLEWLSRISQIVYSDVIICCANHADWELDVHCKHSLLHLN